MTIPTELQDLINVLAELNNERTRLAGKLANAQEVLIAGTRAADDAFATLGDAEFRHSEGGPAPPPKLLTEAARLRTANLSHSAHLQRIMGEIAINNDEIAQASEDLVRARKAFLIREREANTLDFTLIVGECVEKLRPVVAKARGIQNDRVLHAAYSAAATSIGTGHNAFGALREVQKDPEMKALILEWEASCTPRFEHLEVRSN